MPRTCRARLSFCSFGRGAYEEIDTTATTWPIWVAAESGLTNLEMGQQGKPGSNRTLAKPFTWTDEGKPLVAYLWRCFGHAVLAG